MYLVTGATGNVGGEVVAQLLARGARVRVFGRDAARLARWGDRVERAIGDFAAPDSVARAATGADAVFLMTGGFERASFAELAAALRAGGAPRVVFLSTLVADVPELEIGALHKQREDAIRDAGLHATFVRPGGFMSNAYGWIPAIQAEGAVHNAMGGGSFAPIAPEDIAAVVVHALTTPPPAGQVFELTGGELTTVAAQVEILAGVIGKPLRCVDVPVEAFVQQMTRSGAPPHIAAAVGQSFEAIRAGRGAVRKDTVERLLGRPAMTFEAWARKHAARFA